MHRRSEPAEALAPRRIARAALGVAALLACTGAAASTPATAAKSAGAAKSTAVATTAVATPVAAPKSVALPPPNATPSAVKFANVVGWPTGATPTAPAGFKVAAYARALANPRNLLVLPNGDVLVAEAATVLKDAQRRQLPPELLAAFERSNGGARASANRITLLRDSDGDGIADVQSVLLDGLNQPYGLALRRDRLYVANTDGVISCSFLVGQQQIKPNSCRPVLELPADGYNNHWTRNLVFAPDETKLYVSVGSNTNVDVEKLDEKDPHRAAILVATPDGKDVRVYASGLRNPVGLAFEPVSGRLWAAVNERDELGDELVPDYLTGVKAGAFYGWPYAYFGPNEDPRKRGERPDLVAKAVVPDVALGAHTASLGVTFYRAAQFPAAYRGGAFVAQHGSWNRSSFAGYRVVYVPFAKGRPSGEPREFLTGFVKDAQSGEVHGRPAAVAVDRTGALLVADDAGNTIWRVRVDCDAQPASSTASACSSASGVP